MIRLLVRHLHRSVTAAITLVAIGLVSGSASAQPRAAALPVIAIVTDAAGPLPGS